MRDNARRHAAMFAALATLTLAGCGYFAPRDPDEPGDPPDRHAPTAPESVLFNFQQALQEKVLGAPQLAETIDPDFILDLDERDSDRLNGLQVIFKDEFETANRLFLSLRIGANDLSVLFDTTSTPLVPETADSAFYNRLPYKLLVFPQGQSVAIDSIKGEVNLRFKRRTNWAIVAWEDFDVDQLRTETYGYYMGFYAGVSAPGDILK
ncbi:MAG TPA: hypothetical protein VF720_04550, partial [Candidatus Eisenbacteria bacterium]